MAKGSYTRRQTQGGRFKRQDFGDLGLRSYSEQQKQIIDAIKIQRARAKEISSDFAQSMGNVAENEARNQTILQNLENEAYETRRKAMEVRAAREIDALEGKAKEYGAKRDRWLAFSKTEAAKWGTLAQGAASAVDKIRSDLAWHDKEQQLDELAINSAETHDQIESNILKDSHKFWKEDKDASRNLLGNLLFGSGHNDGMRFNQWIKNNKTVVPRLAEQLAKRANEDYWDNPGKWNTEALDRLAAQIGVNTGNKGYRSALQQIQALTGAQNQALIFDREVENDFKHNTKGLDDLIAAANSGDEKGFRNKWNLLIQSLDNSTYKVGDKYSHSGNRVSNYAQAGNKFYEMLIKKKKFASYGESLQLFKRIPIKDKQGNIVYKKDEDGKPTTEPVTWYEKHEGNHGEQWFKSWTAQEKLKKARRELPFEEARNNLDQNITKLETAKDAFFQPQEATEDNPDGKSEAELLGFPKGIKFNYSRPEDDGYRETRNWMMSFRHKLNAEGQAWLDQKLGWDKTNVIKIDKLSELEQAYLLKDKELFYRTWDSLTAAEKKDVNYSSLNQSFFEIQGMDPKELTKEVDAIIDAVEVKEKTAFNTTVYKRDEDANKRIKSLAKLRFYQIYRNLSPEDGTPTQRRKIAIDQLREEVANSKSGLFERSQPGGKDQLSLVTWHAVTTQNKEGEKDIKVVNFDDTSRSLVHLAKPHYNTTKTGEETITAFQAFTNDYPLDTLIAPDTIDNAQVTALENGVIPHNEVISFLAKRFNMTESEVWAQAGVKIRPNMSDMIRKTALQDKDSNDNYQEFLKGIHTLQAKVALRKSFTMADSLGSFPISDYNRNYINTFQNPVETESPLTLTTGLINQTVRNELEAANQSFNLNIDWTNENPFNSFNHESWIRSMREFGGKYNAFTRQPVYADKYWDMFPDTGGSINKTWGIKK